MTESSRSNMARRENLPHEIAKELRSRIFSAQLPALSRIDQDAVAKDLGVSRLPVREALIALESEGLVFSRPRRGVYVESLTRTDVLDHFYIYGLISKLTAERAAANVTDEELSHLQNVQMKLEGSDSPSKQEELNYSFHRTINVKGGSRRTRFVLRSLLHGIPTGFYETHDSWSGESARHHQLILRSLELRDATAAGEAMFEHILESGRRAIELLEASGFWNPDPQE